GEGVVCPLRSGSPPARARIATGKETTPISFSGNETPTTRAPPYKKSHRGRRNVQVQEAVRSCQAGRGSADRGETRLREEPVLSRGYRGRGCPPRNQGKNSRKTYWP